MPIKRESTSEPTAIELPSWYEARQARRARTESPYVACIDAIKCMLTPDQFYGMCIGTALKYIWRSQDKGGATDLQKAIDYLEWAKGALNETQETDDGEY